MTGMGGLVYFAFFQDLRLETEGIFLSFLTYFLLHLGIKSFLKDTIYTGTYALHNILHNIYRFFLFRGLAIVYSI